MNSIYLIISVLSTVIISFVVWIVFLNMNAPPQLSLHTENASWPSENFLEEQDYLEYLDANGEFQASELWPQRNDDVRKIWIAIGWIKRDLFSRPSPMLNIYFHWSTDHVERVILRRNPHLSVHHIKVDRMVKETYISEDSTSDVGYYLGRIESIPENLMAVSCCHGLVGLIVTPWGEYIIQPASKNPPAAKLRLHLIQLTKTGFSSTENSLDSEGFSNMRRIRERRFVVPDEGSGLAEEANHSSSSNTQFSKVRRYMEIMVVADHDVIEFHGKDEVKEYILTLMNIVSAIFTDPSLGFELNLAITKIILREDNTTSIVIPDDLPLSLSSVCFWMNQIYNASGDNYFPDIGIFFSRDNMAGLAGYAYMNGMCNPHRSCSFNKDEGLPSAFVVAHEIAHVLGVNHDNQTKECDEHIEGNIMAPQVLSTYNRFVWSPCSRHQILENIEKFDCLLNKPGTAIWRKKIKPFTVSYSLGEQCRQQFGNGFRFCIPAEKPDPCSKLWCYHISNPDICKTKQGPPLEGTHCGWQKWCVQGACLLKNSSIPSPYVLRHNPLDGGWSEWSTFEPCSRSCGVGTKFRFRKCDNPSPEFGGIECEGESEDYEICNSQKCPEVQDFRSEQCTNVSQVVALKPEQVSLIWLTPHSQNDANPCLLTCVSLVGEEILETSKQVIDGTRCTYGSSYDICVKGQCVPLGCDKKVNSTKEDDACGICGGDGSFCQRITINNTQKIEEPSTQLAILPIGARLISISIEGVHDIILTSTQLAILPIGARLISISIEGVHDIILSVKSWRSGLIILGGKKLALPKDVVYAGTKFTYALTTNQTLLEASGPLLEEIIVQASPTSPRASLKLFVNYTIAEEKGRDDVTSAEEIYQWEDDEWTECSQTCGGGVQQTKIVCRDRRTGNTTGWRFCSLITKPIMHKRKCNIGSSDYRWIAEDWENCSASCGNSGYQTRHVKCVYTNYEESPVLPIYCSGPKPESTKPCNRALCQGEWIFGTWSECSVSCGVGEQTRLVTCLPPENKTLNGCLEMPPTLRACLQPPCTTQVP